MAMGYNYLPEFQGMTDVQQQELQDQFGRARANLARAQGRSPLQSTGAYLEQMAELGSNEAMGLSNIERQNQLKNAMLMREERMIDEDRDFKRKMAEDAYNRQLNMYRMQQEDQFGNMIGNVVGGLVGGFGGQLLGAGLKGLGIGLSPMEKMFSGANGQELLKQYIGYNPGSVQTDYSIPVKSVDY